MFTSQQSLLVSNQNKALYEGWGNKEEIHAMQNCHEIGFQVTAKFKAQPGFVIHALENIKQRTEYNRLLTFQTFV